MAHPFSVSFSGFFSNSSTSGHGRMPRAQSSNFYVHTRSPDDWSSMTPEVSATLNLYLSGLFSDQIPNCPAVLSIFAWMCVQHRNLNMSKAEILVSLAPALLLLLLSHMSVKVLFLLSVPWQARTLKPHFTPLFLAPHLIHQQIPSLWSLKQIQNQISSHHTHLYLPISYLLCKLVSFPHSPFCILFSVQTQRNSCET